MGIPARERTLREVIETLPEGCTGEILAGTLPVNPRPAARHIRIGSKIGARLDGPFDSGDDGPGGWWLLDERASSGRATGAGCPCCRGG